MMDDTKNCKKCIVRLYPSCDREIPCCRCQEKDCNSRQDCPENV